MAPIVFLGGTCAESRWRESLINMLRVDYFNPVVDDWDEDAQKNEVRMRSLCEICLFVITPKMEGVYSIAEVIDDSNKRPRNTIFCFIEEDDGKQWSVGQRKSLVQVGKMVESNGGKFFLTLNEVAEDINIQFSPGSALTRNF